MYVLLPTCTGPLMTHAARESSMFFIFLNAYRCHYSVDRKKTVQQHQLSLRWHLSVSWKQRSSEPHLHSWIFCIFTSAQTTRRAPGTERIPLPKQRNSQRDTPYTDTNHPIYGITLLSQVVPDTNRLVSFGKICWECFELSFLQTEKHTNWRNAPRHQCRMVWLKCYAYFNNI